MTLDRPRPFHLTLMGLLALLWYLVLALDYLVLRYERIAALPGLSELFSGVLEEMPLWASIASGVSVWVGLLAAVLLLLRDRAAVLGFVIAFVGAAVAGGWGLVAAVDGPPGMLGVDGVTFLIAKLAAAFVLWLYARRLKQLGSLG